MLIAHVRYIVILTRLLGFLIVFLYFFAFRCAQVSSENSRQRSREKFAILTLKPWPVVTQNTCYAENKYKIYTLARPPRAEGGSLKTFL